jgi:hypothetical protein
MRVCVLAWKFSPAEIGPHASWTHVCAPKLVPKMRFARRTEFAVLEHLFLLITIKAVNGQSRYQDITFVLSNSASAWNRRYINVQTCCNHDVSEACCSVSNGLPMCQLHIIHMKITGLVLQESFNYSYLSFRYLGVCTPTMCVPYDPKSCACVHLDYEKQQYCKTGWVSDD